MKLAKCGTPVALRRHRSKGETCQKCEAKPWKILRPHGTQAAIRRHYRLKEVLCAECKKEQLWAWKEWVAVTPPEIKRHRRRNDMRNRQTTPPNRCVPANKDGYALETTMMCDDFSDFNLFG